MRRQTIKEIPLRWWTFATASILCVAGVFGVVFILERTLFEDASLQRLQYLYVIRGASASFVVMALAGLFFETRHRRIEGRLRKFSRAVEQSPSTVIMTDHTGNIEYVNPRFTQLTGYAPEEAIGKNPRILQSGQTPPQTYRSLWETIASGREWRGEFLNKRKNGELYWESASITALVDPKGDITHYIGVLEDVTARKKLDQLKDELVGRVSHELRTPLGIIKWSLSELEESIGGFLKKDQKDVLESIFHNCERLERTINEVLDLSRLESGKVEVRRQRVNIIPLILESVQNFQKISQDNHLVLDADLPPTLPDLSVDSDMIAQILNNLLENALRFARKNVTIQAEATGSSVQVIVKDDGPGIAPEDRKRLFSKFEQIQRPVGRGGYKGTGLGLVICKEIVERLDGKIWVESEAGKGAKFYFTLPVAKEVNYGETKEKSAHYR